MKDLNAVTWLEFSGAAANTSTVTGAAVDMGDYVGNVSIMQHVQTVTGTAPTLDGHIEDSPDGSTDWQDITGATWTQVTAADNTAIRVSTRTGRLHWRYVGTIAGTTPSFTMAVLAVAENHRQ